MVNKLNLTVCEEKTELHELWLSDAEESAKQKFLNIERC